MKHEDTINKLLEDKSSMTDDTVEYIADNSRPVSDEQKDRILKIIEMKENLNNKNEEKVHTIKYKKNYITTIAAVAACMCIVCTAAFFGNSLKNELPPVVSPDATSSASDTVQISKCQETVISYVTDKNKKKETAKTSSVTAQVTSATSETSETKHEDVTAPVTSAISETAETKHEGTKNTANIRRPDHPLEDYKPYYEYQVIYRYVIDGLRAEKENMKVTYFIHDMNNDDELELITLIQTDESDASVQFYTIIDHEAVLVGDDFRGDHASFFYDVPTNKVVIRNEYMGSGDVTSYEFDGKTVKACKDIENFIYADFTSGTDYMDEYENKINSMFSLETLNNHSGGYIYSNGESYLFNIDGSTTKLEDNMYTFADFDDIS